MKLSDNTVYAYNCDHKDTAEAFQCGGIHQISIESRDTPSRMVDDIIQAKDVLKVVGREDDVTFFAMIEGLEYSSAQLSELEHILQHV